MGSVGRCAVDNTTCITPDRHSRRLLVNDQIRRLKQLLKQLKVSQTAAGDGGLTQDSLLMAPPNPDTTDGTA